VNKNANVYNYVTTTEAWGIQTHRPMGGIPAVYRSGVKVHMPIFIRSGSAIKKLIGG
jgi:hypothetical protein